MSKTIECKILSPVESLFSGSIEQVKLPLGNGGSFAVLHDHAPLLAKFSKGEITVSSEGQEKTINSETGGIAKVKNNTITILVK